MYPKLNSININEFQNSIKGKNTDIKNIVKLINNQYSNSFKNPFSNVMLRKTIIRQKIKTLNQIKKNMKQKKKDNKKITFKQNNLYINLSDYYEQNKQKQNKINNNSNYNFNNILNSFDENNFYKNIRNNDFSPHRKVFKSRNIKHLKFLPISKTIHNLKFKSYTKEYTDKKIVYINNKVVRINRMNITINNKPKFIQFDDNFKKFLPKIEEEKNYNRIHNKIKNLRHRNNNKGKIKSLKTTQISQYLTNNQNILYKNRTNNYILPANEYFFKSASAKRNSNLYDDYNTHKEKKNYFNNNFLSNEIINSKKSRINIFTLLSLKKNGKI